jgi:hypothetical protein
MIADRVELPGPGVTHDATSFPHCAFLLDWNFSHIRTSKWYAQLFLLMRNSERFSPQRPLHRHWREFVSLASTPPLLRTIKRRLVLACLEISLQ